MTAQIIYLARPNDGTLDNAAIAVVVGRRLRVLRQTLGYETPAAFAAALGYRTRNYLAYERGERTQGAATARLNRAVHELTGVSFDWLFCGDNHPGLRQVRGVDGQQISFLHNPRVVDGEGGAA